MRQTTITKPKDLLNPKWFVLDADGLTLGRFSTAVATILMGKHKPIYSPNIDSGDFVIILNAKKIKLTGQKMEKKKYYNHSMYPGGLRVRSAKTMIEDYPVEMIERSIHGMLPSNKMGRKMAKKLFVYEGSEHPHKAQNPEPIKL